MFLAEFQLSPTIKSLNHEFSIKYYVNLILIDKDDKRYY